MDFASIKEKIRVIYFTFEQLKQKSSGRESEFEKLKEVIEDNENDKFAFIH
jgi:hypothetical protein